MVAAGTDQSSGPALQRELELLVAAGIKPFDVLTIATHNGAVLLGKADTLGSVEPGKLADLLLLNADPTADIENVKKIAFVVKGGQIVDESQTAAGRRPAEAAVHALEAPAGSITSRSCRSSDAPLSPQASPAGMTKASVGPSAWAPLAVQRRGALQHEAEEEARPRAAAR